MNKLLLSAVVATLIGLPSLTMAAASTCGQGPLKCTIAADDLFIEDDFVINLSAGVNFTYAESATAVGAGAYHPKGGFGYSGTSDGGSIIKCTAANIAPTADSSGTGGASDCTQ
jgi:hypothetical protein